MRKQLSATGGRDMRLAFGRPQFECVAEHGLQFRRRIARHLQPVAARRSILGERRDHYVPAWPYRMSHVREILRVTPAA